MLKQELIKDSKSFVFFWYICHLIRTLYLLCVSKLEKLYLKINASFNSVRDCIRLKDTPSTVGRDQAITVRVKAFKPTNSSLSRVFRLVSNVYLFIYFFLAFLFFKRSLA